MFGIVFCFRVQMFWHVQIATHIYSLTHSLLLDDLTALDARCCHFTGGFFLLAIRGTAVPLGALVHSCTDPHTHECTIFTIQFHYCRNIAGRVFSMFGVNSMNELGLLVTTLSTFPMPRKPSTRCWQLFIYNNNGGLSSNRFDAMDIF